MESVSWNDAQEFISKLNRQTGKSYRLLTEAEWEYAARSGSKREKYSGSDNIDAVAWSSSNSSGAPHPVGAKAANGLGIYDMSGNVWEWCQDWYGDSYYGSSPRSNAVGPASGSFRVFRGGSWASARGVCGRPAGSCSSRAIASSSWVSGFSCQFSEPKPGVPWRA